jgi:hypothetical protein
VLREKGTPFHQLDLGDASLSHGVLLEAIMAHPILLNRRCVVTPKGVRLCRPPEVAPGLLPPRLANSSKRTASESTMNMGDAWQGRDASACQRRVAEFLGAAGRESVRAYGRAHGSVIVFGALVWPEPHSFLRTQQNVTMTIEEFPTERRAMAQVAR